MANPLNRSNDSGDARSDFKDLEGYKTPLNSPNPFHQEVLRESKYPTVALSNVPPGGRDMTTFHGETEEPQTLSKESGQISTKHATRGKVEVAGNHPNKKLKNLYG